MKIYTLYRENKKVISLTTGTVGKTKLVLGFSGFANALVCGLSWKKELVLCMLRSEYSH